MPIFNFCNDAQIDPNVVLHVGWYHKYKSNLRQAECERLGHEDSDWSQGVIYQVKQFNNSGLRTSVEILKSIIGDTTMAIVAVPSSTKGNTQHGITKICQMIASELDNVEDQTKALKRTESKLPAHKGGARGSEAHETTLAASKKRIAGKTVLLVDEVTTSGASIDVSRNKLIEAGATTVISIVLSKTYSRDNYPDISAVQMALFHKVASSFPVVKGNIDLTHKHATGEYFFPQEPSLTASNDASDEDTDAASQAKGLKSDPSIPPPTDGVSTQTIQSTSDSDSESVYHTPPTSPFNMRSIKKAVKAITSSDTAFLGTSTAPERHSSSDEDELPTPPQVGQS